MLFKSVLLLAFSGFAVLSAFPIIEQPRSLSTIIRGEPEVFPKSRILLRETPGEDDDDVAPKPGLLLRAGPGEDDDVAPKPGLLLRADPDDDDDVAPKPGLLLH